ncbi:thioredoxin reductase 1, cytoplasmic-like [Macrosteles quadrilineatus]|uniref:thioredoxin reductase 1, cytoplasmic-like n=1 Tax=Macrosteles quadrilineatus TaxID=74068 RepID=UPI0023E33BE0|nr:thioredoxin reductase 1, cytoplasmic-like [Macrosteles quadrilineatus]
MQCAVLLSRNIILFISTLKVVAPRPSSSRLARRFGSGNLTFSAKMETNLEIESAFRGLIDTNKIVIFSKTTCPFCKKVKNIFNQLQENYHALELDNYPAEKTSQMQDVLKDMTGQRTVPNVFINKQHVGGCTDTEQALADGTLFDRLEGTFNTYDYDYIVIGGGSGGLASAKEASSYGRKVACCDLVLPSPQGTSWGLGGTCVNVGCIPKKLMHKAALMGEDIEDSAYFGWTTDNKRHSWEEMVTNIQDYIKSLNFKYRTDLKKKEVTYYNAYAKFVDKHTLNLYNKEGNFMKTITGQNFLLAMGCRPVYPDFPGARDLCISSDDVFSLKEPPGKTLIIGASYIALETAGFLVGLGFDVTVMVRSILLRGFDQDIANKIGETLEAHGVKFVPKHVPESVTKNGENLLVRAKSLSDGSEYIDTFKTVFLAIGREPCTTGIGLENLNVKFQESSTRIEVNEFSQTSVRNIFAVGDVVEEKLQLTPVAIQAGKLLAKRLYGKGKALFDYNHVPTTVFTPLEYGCVGYSEEDAMKKFPDQIEVYHLHFQPLEWDLNKRNKNKSYGKLICLKSEQERVVGFHYLGPNAGEITQGFALALKLGAKKDDFNNLIGIHPTCAEIFTTMTITKASGKPAEAGGC